MGFLIDWCYLVSLGLCSALVCGGLLTAAMRLLPLVDRQRATLWGVGQ